ncbi:AAA ATPase-like protein [Kribbella sp. VKM Ac-2571]|nr:AAA ATPase-like protein [Kribbella sp. VKM Ac-2571]
MALRGEAGIGKTELLKYLAGRSPGCRVVRATGIESEMELSYAGLHQLIAPLLGGIGRLPEPQRNALSAAFGLSDGEMPSRFHVGLATLGLLADAAASQPLICLVDDVQWLDRASAQTLEFVARRLLAESVLLVFAVREPTPGPLLTGIAELHVGALADADSRTLLDSIMPGRLDRSIRDRVIAEARGNPLALLELPRGLTPAELAGGFVTPDANPLPSQIEEGFRRRIHALPADAQRFLFTAAAEAVGDLSVLRRAAERLGIAMDPTASIAESSGLIGIDTHVRFRHPLVRSAAYRATELHERRLIHQALADATDARLNPDSRAWHLAHASTGPDESVAAELVVSAGRAQARGGVAAAAAFLTRAAELTPDPAQRAVRALAAAEAKFQAGAFDEALELAGAAELVALDDLDSARLTLLRGRIMSVARSSSAGLPFLLDAARRLQPLDPGLARDTFRDAIHAAVTAGGLTAVEPELAEAVLAAPGPAGTVPGARLLDGVARTVAEGYDAGAPIVLAALADFRTDGVRSTDEELGWLPIACRAAHETWDFESWSVLSARLVDAARESGALSVLPLALLLRLSNRSFTGDLPDADSLGAEAVAVGEATGAGILSPYVELFLEPWRGNEAATRRAIDALRNDLFLRGQPKVLTDTYWAAAVLYNGLGRYREAYEAARRGSEHPDELGLSTQAMVELVEASAHLGRSADAAGAVRSISDMARTAGTDWAIGTAARVRALVTGGSAADDFYREAIDRLDRAGVRMELARVQLNYGEWLHRQGRRMDARAQLGRAHELFSRTGAAAFAERARVELEATGFTVHRRSTAMREPLTTQEAHVARLAADGLTNPQIGARLFISPHTVDWHLRKVYSKLGIKSRRELPTTLADVSA